MHPLLRNGSFDPSTSVFTLASDNTPTDAHIHYLAALALDARRIALLHTSSSLLLGQTSESDEDEDIALWLGPGDFGKDSRLNILKALGLDENVDPISADPSLAKHLGELERLQDRHSFQVNYGSTVVVFLLGRLDNAWVGLMGSGIWT